MPRSGGRSGGFGGRSGGFGRSSGTSKQSNLPAKTGSPPPPPQTYQPQPAQPGLFGQMMATAGGVAIGSAVGHTVGAAITGSMSGKNEVQQQPVNQPEGITTNQQNPCQMYLEQFLNCSKNESDLTMCSAFNDSLKDCQRYYGLS